MSQLQSLLEWNASPAARRFPSADQSTCLIQRRSADFSSAMSLPVGASQSRTASSLAVATCWPSGDQARRFTPSLCCKVRRSCPDSASQSRTVLSLLTEASSLPSGDQATWRTALVWTLMVEGRVPEAASQRQIVLLSLPEAKVRPSGDQSTVRILPAA